MRKKIVIAVSLLFLAGSAAALEADIEAVDSEAGETPAEFKVTVYNTGFQEERFRLSIGSQKSQWFTHDDSKSIEPGGNKTFTVNIHSPEDALQGNYGFRVHVNALESGRVTTVEDIFTVSTPYDLSISSLELDESDVKPRGEVDLQVEIQNLARTEIEDYSIEVSSPHFNGSIETFPISSGGSEFFNFEENVGKAYPGEFNGKITVFESGEEGDSRKFTYTVLENRNISESRKVEDLIVYRDVEMRAENLGNVDDVHNFTAEIPVYLEPFTFFEEEPDHVIEEEGFNRYVWEKEIKRDSVGTVNYTVNTWIPVAIIAIAVILLLALNNLRTGLRISKTVEEVEEGVKVRIEVKNVSRESFDSLELRDFVPDIASVKKEFDFAKPVIRKTSDGTKLTWTLEGFDRGDQRIFEYVIKPKVSVDEKVELQGAELVDGEEVLASSGETEATF